MRYLIFLFVLSPLFARNVSVATWNMQTFFDARTEGAEYSDFKGERWSEDAYKARVLKAAAALKKIGSDVIVLEEVENEGVLFDLYNELCTGFSWKKPYKYACFEKEEGASIGVALLSRYEILSVRCHSVDVRPFGSRRSTRPILESRVKIKNDCVTVFSNHWKSRLGGGKVVRAVQERALALFVGRCIREGERVIACGDFNSDISEFSSLENAVCLRSYGEKATKMRSVWLSFPEVESGSYCFRGKWERIDHIFFSPDIESLSFCVFDSSPFVNDKGEIDRYSVFSGKGLSDHLPLCALFKI